MEPNNLVSDTAKTAEEILGYLNFSSGAPDPRFLKDLNKLFDLIESTPGRTEPTWQKLGQMLRASLEQLRGTSEAFRRSEQAEAVLRLVFDTAFQSYREHHRDLLFHQTDEQLFQPFFIGRMCEAVLQQDGPWNETDRIVRGALSQLNDFLGYRPVAVLQTEQKIRPYAHEFVRAIPLYIRGAGVAAGRFRALIEKGLAIIEETDPTLLFQAWFDPEMLDELALDPRAYDFDHPVNRRPNYLFGQWDLHNLDNSGRCRRFVVQQISLEAMLDRVENRGKLPYEEVLVEAAAVLAGTMLMGSGISGNGPDAHDSAATLNTLVQHIAAYRDVFYEQLLGRLSGPHAERLRAEAVTLRQPFGGVRQEFNQHLARHRARQIQHVGLAQLFSRMGYPEAAVRQVRVVPVVSARMQCDIHCRIIAARWELEQGQLERAADMLPEIEDQLHRAIECGALVDPWNILGFDAQFSLFPALENSIPDHRVDELIGLVGEIFDLCVQIQKEAAAAGNAPLQESVSQHLDKLAQWWDKYASVEVNSVEGISGQESKESADHVAAALRARREAGTAAGDIAFWRGRAEQFSSPKAYALVAEALIEQRDPVAAMALLVQWVSQAEQISLIEENYSFYELALRWMNDLWQNDQPPSEKPTEGPTAAKQRWALSRKFLDYLEANAEDYWEVPKFELAGDAPQGVAEEEDDSDNLFSAAYEDVTYRDSTNDGFEGETLEGGDSITDVELVQEADRIITRLNFLTTIARLWKLVALTSMPDAVAGARADGDERDDVLAGWLRQATTNRRQLLQLLAALDRYRIPPPRGTHESLVEYDHHRSVKEMALEQIITACVETADAARLIRAAMLRHEPADGLDAWEKPAELVLRAVLHADVDATDEPWDELIDTLRQEPLLYVALARGGNPQRIVASRSIQQVLKRLLTYLPRLGLLCQTHQLIETIQEMELEHPVGQGAITEFDRMFQIGCRAIVRCLVVSSEDWYLTEPNVPSRQSDLELIDCLEHATEALLRSWLVHSRGVRLSVLETVRDQSRWRKLKQFIERYGADLFTQKFLNLGNLRAILHQGVDAYLETLEEEPDAEEEFQLMRQLDGPLSREEAVAQLGVILEAVVENYAEYIDYNSITTQSDRGEMLYTLLDFLRLQASYDRVAWNVQPVVWAHEVLARLGRDEAAEIWRGAVMERTADIAGDHLKRLKRLGRKYGMRLPSIADRLGERFVQPLAIDRLRALVHPAIEALRNDRCGDAFERLEEGIVPFTEEISGAGFEMPTWLEALQQEVDQIHFQDADDDSIDPPFHISQVHLSTEEARREVEEMATDETE